mgnify:CR=1 FL=1
MPTPIYSTSGAERTLAASGAYEYSEILKVAEKKLVCLQLAYDAAAIGGYPVILPLVSYAENQPSPTDDAWFAMPATDGVPAATSLSGALPAGADYTLAPSVGLVDVRPLAVKPLAAATATSNEVRQSIALDLSSVPGARWLMFAIAEVGVTATPGAALVTATVG